MTEADRMAALAVTIKAWGRELGFADVRITDVDLSHREAGFADWLAKGYHGEMDYMATHGMKRARPAELVPGTVSVITARMPYLPQASAGDWREREAARMDDPQAAVVSVYARGRDYHKVIRARLQQLATRIEQQTGPFGYRVFTDSAPVMEVALAEKAGLGWRGKHTLLLHREAGSMFFLGEILTDLPLPPDEPASAHCGQCTTCIDICPTQAIVGPYELDARRCISYLTIELKGSIPVALRSLIGNRVYGCDDCQLFCPWNKFAQPTTVGDFDERNGLGAATLVELFAWTEAEFDRKMEGSAIRRIGHERWLRNIAVGLGNAGNAGAVSAIKAAAEKATITSEAGVVTSDKAVPDIIEALRSRLDDPSDLVREHVRWALQQHGVAPD
jgi:epoxyqueuosine reductase